MTGIQHFSSGRPWEIKYCHSRAIVYGGIFETCLTSPSEPDGSIVCPGDVYGQTQRCLAIIEGMMAQAGYDLALIVRSDVYMLDTRLWEDAARAHRDFAGAVARPVLSFIGCANFWDPDILVEVAIKAYRPA